MRLLEDTLDRTAKIISQRAHVRVVFKGNEKPYTDGKEIVLPSLPSPCPEDIQRVFHGVVDHEVGHCLHSDFSVIGSFKTKHGEKKFFILNALEDVRIEEKMAKEFIGAKENLEWANQHAMAKWKENIHSIPLYSRVIGCIIAVGKGYDSALFGTDANQLIGLVKDLVLKAPLESSTAAVAKLATKIIRRWKNLLDSADEKKPVIKQNIKEILNDNNDGQTLSLGTVLQASLNEAPCKGQRLPYRVYDRSMDIIKNAPESDDQGYQTILDEVRPHVSALRQRLLLTLRGRTQTLAVADPNGNILDKRRLHEALYEYPKPPFLSKTEEPANDTAVSLLLDLSGSMVGDPIRLARQCMVLLSETCEKLKIGFEVIGFTTRDRSHLAQLRKSENESPEDIEARFARYVPTIHFIFKGFKESLRKCKGRFTSVNPKGYTCLNESILFAAKRLLSTRASRRIILVISDGNVFLGSTSTQQTAEDNLRDNLALVDKTRTEIIGIGIKTDYGRKFFKQWIVVNELAELPVQFYQCLSKKLLKNGRS